MIKMLYKEIFDCNLNHSSEFQFLKSRNDIQVEEEGVTTKTEATLEIIKGVTITLIHGVVTINIINITEAITIIIVMTGVEVTIIIIGETIKTQVMPILTGQMLPG